MSEQEQGTPKIKKLAEQTRQIKIVDGKVELVPPSENDGENANFVCGFPCQSMD